MGAIEILLPEAVFAPTRRLRGPDDVPDAAPEAAG